MTANKILPNCEPHGGCPHRCVFCDQKQITGRDRLPSREELVALVPDDLDPETEIAFYGGSFTAIPSGVRRAYLDFAKELKDAGRISGIRISTHPAYIDEEILSELLDFGVGMVELGIQSTDDEVLKVAKRGHGSEEVFLAASLLAASPLRWGVQLMVGLPEDSEEKALRSVASLLPYHPDTARIYPVLVLKGTALEAMTERNEYAPLSLADAVSQCGKMFAMFSCADVQVIRTGLQPTEEIHRGSDSLVAGPFHPAFGHLVKCFLKREQMKMLLANFDGDRCRILAPKRDMPLIFGHDGTHLEEIACGRLLAVSESDLPLGAVALAPYEKHRKTEILSLLTEKDFLEQYTKYDRSISCI
ncbi:MAG: radical SAM protein [Firmicutes bacterium]|nr:radical SAM protein [Bacillota bacterium]